MAKKQVNVKENAAAATPALPARAAKPRAPRVKAAQHSKIVSSEPAAVAVQTAADNSPEDAEAAIARIAYGYWEARGYQGGSAIEDWVRAESEYRQLASVIH